MKHKTRNIYKKHYEFTAINIEDSEYYKIISGDGTERSSQKDKLCPQLAKDIQTLITIYDFQKFRIILETL